MRISLLEKRFGDLEKPNQRIGKRKQRLSARQASVNHTEKKVMGVVKVLQEAEPVTS